MATKEKLSALLQKKELEVIFDKLYGRNNKVRMNQKKRYHDFFELCKDKLPDGEPHLFSVPGRIEIGGNHTDHNHGKVIAASVNLDAVCCAVPVDEQVITLYSKGFDKAFSVKLNSLSPLPEEEGTTSGLIRGICAEFVNAGYKISGFTAYMVSDVMVGSGLSSSAVVEVLIGKILSVLFNNDSIDPVTIAKTGQFAENRYFGKPCGLMDQTACSVGGIVAIDFNDPQNPDVKKVDFNFADYNYKVLVVNTGGSHADLTEDYASIPIEMKEVAGLFNKDVLRELSMNQVLNQALQIRKTAGDRAFLRAYHFFMENDRVDSEVKALENKDIKSFLTLINRSGDSSFKYLQNIFSVHNTREQGISLALALSEDFIRRSGNGACRVHGGGFAGTIQVFLHDKDVEKYKNMIESVFGEDSVFELGIRQEGSLHLNSYLAD
ncbi:galactokinase [bacterium]|nr:galactokinase [bacterium]